MPKTHAHAHAQTGILTRPKGLLDPKIRDEMSDFLEIFPTEDQI